MLIEVIACSVEDAVAAERGGAGRLELVRALDKGGLTPPFDFVEEVMRKVTIPVRVMIRETADYFAGDAAAVERLAGAAAAAGALGVDGIVVGFLRDSRIDAAAMNAVLNAAPSTNATFHHAFDELPDPPAAIERLQAWPQIDRVLTSAGRGNWEQKASRVKAWSRAASPVGLLAGGGVDLSAVRVLARSGAREAHVGRAARMPPTTEGAVSAQRVAELVEAAGQ
ncbi:MAG TPA: copper homeostasis protein CutC [Vicinamibacterales bacterium]|nr:copper homeostasis protein CutC [Vicinamibacterales bacterium]